MMRTVQVAIADGAYVAALREALSHTGPWRVEQVERPDLDRASVVVLDELAFARLPLPLTHPERVVLIARQDPDALAQAWEAGIVSVVSTDNPPATVLLAVMAAALRVTTGRGSLVGDGICPNPVGAGASIGPQIKSPRSKRCKFR